MIAAATLPTAMSHSERREAFEKIISENQATLLRVARRLCARREDEEQDLVQDAFVRAYEAFIDGRLRPDSNTRAWLITILTNRFLNVHKRRTRWEADLEDEHLADEVDRAASAEGPEEKLVNATLDEQLEKALASLPKVQRACVVLVDIEGLEYVEAAAALAIPVGTVRSRLSRARYQLHALLHGYAQSKRWI
jgi:RNA polymerase sigma-70 factor (ECF subfamily)